MNNFVEFENDGFGGKSLSKINFTVLDYSDNEKSCSLRFSYEDCSLSFSFISWFNLARLKKLKIFLESKKGVFEMKSIDSESCFNFSFNGVFFQIGCHYEGLLPSGLDKSSSVTIKADEGILLCPVTSFTDWIDDNIPI